MNILKFLVSVIFLIYCFSSDLKAKNLEIEITKNLRCLICQGQSVYDSDSEFANSLKILVEKKLNEGLDEKQIYAYLKNKYGDWILYDPGFSKNTYFLWLLPILMFIFGGAIILRKVILKKKKIMNYLRICYLVLLSFLISSSIFAEETKVSNDNTKFNIYSGMFDFSDNGKRSTLIGFQHQNTDLNRDTFLGNLSPITGFMFTADSAAYLYTGVQAQYSLGALNIIPSFTPGLYSQGDGKDLGHLLEFKSEVQISLDLFQNTQLGLSYNHLSNASLGDKNPGANSYMFNFLKTF